MRDFVEAFIAGSLFVVVWSGFSWLLWLWFRGAL